MVAMVESAVEVTGQRLLDAPVSAANNVAELLAILSQPATHSQASTWSPP